MLIALVAMFASAETYNYLKFTKTNGSTVTYSVEATIALAEVQDMYFSNEAGGSDFIRGDVNGDSNVNITDVTSLINYLLSQDATGINLDAANCNQDDGISISDVTTLVNYLLSGNW